MSCGTSTTRSRVPRGAPSRRTRPNGASRTGSAGKGRRRREVMAAAYERFLSGELSFAEQRRVRVREFLEAELDDASADAWIADYTVRYEEAWTVFADVVPALGALTVGYRHGLVPNSSKSCQDRKLRIPGLRDRFACPVCSDEAGAAKPDPVIFLAGCAALGLPRSRSRTSVTVWTRTLSGRRRRGCSECGWTGRGIARGGAARGGPPGHRTGRAGRRPGRRRSGSRPPGGAGIPFWSRAPDRVMFFLRRRAGRKAGSGRKPSEAPQGRSDGVWGNWQPG